MKQVRLEYPNHKTIPNNVVVTLYSCEYAIPITLKGNEIDLTKTMLTCDERLAPYLDTMDSHSYKALLKEIERVILQYNGTKHRERSTIVNWGAI